MLITGNTYPVKDQIKALGGRWNRAAQGWDVPADTADQARAIVDAAGPAVEYRGKRRSSKPSHGSRYTRFSSGSEHFQNERGRCEDAPCCGCCS